MFRLFLLFSVTCKYCPKIPLYNKAKKIFAMSTLIHGNQGIKVNSQSKTRQITYQELNLATLNASLLPITQSIQKEINKKRS